MLISEQAKDLVKNLEAICLLFNRGFTSGILNKSIVSESRKVPCDDLCGESESFTEQFDDVSPVLSVEIL